MHLGIEVVYNMSATAHPRSSVVASCRHSTAHCPLVVWQCIAKVPMPTTPKQWGSVHKGFHHPLPQGSE